MLLYIVRHGETEENERGLLQGQTPGTLTSKGIEQAERLGRVFEGKGIGTIYSSDLSRALRTAFRISDVIGAIVLTESRLRERSLGRFEGRPRSEFFDSQGKSGEPYILYRPSEGETIEEMRSRIGPFLAEITSGGSDENILLVGHGGVNTIILEMLLPMTLDEIWSVGQDNACLNILEIEGAMHAKAVLLNSCEHLNEVEDSEDSR